jgi:hypothetical protein
MRISERHFPALLGLAALGLAACDPSMVGNAPSRATVNVAGGPVVVAGPRGFCVDRSTLNVTDAGAFALLGDCAQLGGGTGGLDRSPQGAALTASISAGGLTGEGDDPAGSLAELAAFVQTTEGRALLSRSGRPNQVRILTTRAEGDVLYVLVEDRGPQPFGGVQPRFWRAFTEVNERMAVLSVLGFEGAGIDEQASLNLLASFVAAMHAANGA